MKLVIKIAIILLLLILLILTGYVIYLSATYYRIDDNLEQEIEDNTVLELNKNDELSILTYNIGFGAYSQDYSFFMDKGEYKDGKKTTGKYAKGISKDNVLKNSEGAKNTVISMNPDFIFLQEVDTNSTRSYHINQKEMFGVAYSTYDRVYASNFHTGYLAYPLFDNHGTVNSGIYTLSKYNISSSVRRSLPITKSFISKFFDLDRCMQVTRVSVNDKELVLINVHMSAYDEGGVYRKKQLELLNGILSSEKEKGNYVIVGGDYNQAFDNSLNYFESLQKPYEGLAEISDDDLATGYKFAKTSKEVPTVRGADIPYKKGETYTSIIDGFIVSENIEIIETKNINTEFMYSDHNPVYMRFKLK